MYELAVTAVVVLVVFVIHGVLAVYLYRSLLVGGSPGADCVNARESVPDTGRADRSENAPAATDVPAERTVRCPTCGVWNAPEFRFCRRCVSDLSKATTSSESHGSSGLGG
jgi:hypothetical protein